MRAIHEVMVAKGIFENPKASHFILPESTFTEVVQYTNNFCDSDRWKIYKNALNFYMKPKLIPANYRIAHIDIGCGPGLFSWVLLDWAQEHGIEPDRLGLYGYDYNKEMVRLAEMIHSKLDAISDDYPNSYYHYDSEQFLQRLTDDYNANTDYIITFGYVLAANHYESDIECFTEILRHILGMRSGDSKCFLLASDATSISKGDFSCGWGKLLHSLEASGIEHKPVAPVEKGRYQ